MGYYNGQGVTSAGGSTVCLRNTGPAVGGAFYVYQRIKSLITQKNGVELATCTAENGEISMNFWQWPGGMVEPGCRGTRKIVSFSQINGSNLYALMINNETVQVRGKQGSYDSGWVS